VTAPQSAAGGTFNSTKTQTQHVNTMLQKHFFFLLFTPKNNQEIFVFLDVSHSLTLLTFAVHRLSTSMSSACDANAKIYSSILFLLSM